MSEHKSAHEVLGDAKKALDTLKQTGHGLYEPFRAAMVELEAGQVRLGHMAERLEQQERSHSLYRTARDSDHAEASREITRLREFNGNLAKQVAALSSIPDSQHEDVMKDAAEVCEWLSSLGAGNSSNIPRGSFVKAAEVIRRLLLVSKTLIEHQPEAINLNQMRGELVELAGNTPGNAETVDALVRGLTMALKVIDRDQRARLRKEVGL